MSNRTKEPSLACCIRYLKSVHSLHYKRVDDLYSVISIPFGF